MTWEFVEDEDGKCGTWFNEYFVIKREMTTYGYQYILRDKNGKELDSCQTIDNIKKKAEKIKLEMRSLN